MIKNAVTMPISQVTRERAFSKMKIIKNYLRNSMTDKRLSDLTVLAIERDFDINFERVEKFKDLEFYNIKDFDIKFADNDERLCYIQLRAAEQGTNCVVNYHSDALFCDVHTCIANGTGKGGMHYLIGSKEDYD
ncbi:unnamed protein product [Rotaria sp. Silwood2]|nr:unnamed protein product [Rotaria sp. Silwood2]